MQYIINFAIIASGILETNSEKPNNSKNEKKVEKLTSENTQKIPTVSNNKRIDEYFKKI